MHFGSANFVYKYIKRNISQDPKNFFYLSYGNRKYCRCLTAIMNLEGEMCLEIKSCLIRNSKKRI